MQIEDEAILLSVKKHGERAGIVRALTKTHGMFAGVAARAFTSKERSNFEPGTLGHFSWKARLSEHIGSLSFEPSFHGAAFALDSGSKLSGLSAACALCDLTLPERAPENDLFTALQHLLKCIAYEPSWLPAYVAFELELLSSLGFRLDLESCAATGLSEDLHYVSPKSGRAVSKDAGAEYADKLFTLPKFLKMSDTPASVSTEDVLASLNMTGYFIEKWLLAPHEWKMPAARTRLIKFITMEFTKKSDALLAS